MPIHDTYARITPFELLVPDEDFADRRFPLIRKEAEERKVNLADPERFVLLGEAGAVLREIRGDDEDPRHTEHTQLQRSDSIGEPRYLRWSRCVHGQCQVNTTLANFCGFTH